MIGRTRRDQDQVRKYLNYHTVYHDLKLPSTYLSRFKERVRPSGSFHD